MKTAAVNPVHELLELRIREMRFLLDQLEPADRLNFLNQLMIRLMPSRKQPVMVNQKLEHSKAVHALTEQQRAIIAKMTSDTEKLKNSREEDDAC